MGNLFMITIGILVLVGGAELMVYGAREIAIKFGVSETLIGLTIVAFGTSLPELATSIVGALKKQGDIIVGNAVGSCVFNILAVVGITGSISPLKAVGISTVDLAVMVGVSILVLPLMWHRSNINRIEGFLLLSGYFGYLGWTVIASS